MNIQLVNINKTFIIGYDQSYRVLKNANFTFQTGLFYAINGGSGSGKTTLLNIIGLLDDFDNDGGYITYDNNRISQKTNYKIKKAMLRKIGFIFQNYNLIPTLTVIDNVSLPLKIARIQNPNKIAITALEKVGLASKCNYYPSLLSGGEQQRVSIARAIVKEPKLILADEPTGNLDSSNRDIIIELIIDIATSSHATLLCVTHDNSIAKRFDKKIDITRFKSG